MFQGKIEDLRQRTHVIVLPEMFSTGFSMQPQKLAEAMDGPTVEWMRNTAQQYKCIITGSIIIEEDGKYYNRLIWMLPTGDCGWYNKRHLFAYAGEDKQYSAGTQRLITSVNGWRINTQVCYDLRFPVWARQTAHPPAPSPREGVAGASDGLRMRSSFTAPLERQPSETKVGNEVRGGEVGGAEYDILLYVANWPQRRIGAWKTLLQARAIENQCYVVAVNRVGDDGNGIAHNGCSAVISPLGEVLYQKEDEEDVFTITLQKEELEAVRKQFPFLGDRDSFQILI